MMPKQRRPYYKKTMDILAQPEAGFAPTKGEFSADVQNKGTEAAVNAIKKVMEEMKKHVDHLKGEYDRINGENQGLIQAASKLIKDSKKALAIASGQKGEHAGHLALTQKNLGENSNAKFEEQLWWGETGTNDKWGSGYACTVFMAKESMRNASGRSGEWNDAPERPMSPFQEEVATAQAEIAQLDNVEGLVKGLQGGMAA